MTTDDRKSAAITALSKVIADTQKERFKAKDDKERWEWRAIEEYGWPPYGSIVEFYIPRIANGEHCGEKWLCPCEFWAHETNAHGEPYTVDNIKESVELRAGMNRSAIYWRYLDLPIGQQTIF